MKRNRAAIIIVIILGAISFWFIVNKRNGTIKETLRDFAVKDTAAITKIFLADKKGNSVTLERKSPNAWTVNGKYNARMDAIQTLMVTIRKVDVKEPVGKAAQDNVVKRLAAKAVRCEIYSGNELVKAYYVGTETQDMTGTYMILMDPETLQPSAKPFITYIPGFEGYLTTRYFTEENGWRDRTLFQYVPSDIKSVRLETPYTPELSYQVDVKDNNSYEVTMLHDKKKLQGIDTIAVKQYLSYFQQLGFESFEVEMSQHDMDSVMKSKPVNILTVTDNKGSSRTVKFFAKKPKKAGMTDVNGKVLEFDPERMNAVLDDGKELLLVQYYIFGKVMPPPTYFLKVKPTPGKA